MRIPNYNFAVEISASRIQQHKSNVYADELRENNKRTRDAMRECVTFVAQLTHTQRTIAAQLNGKGDTKNRQH